MDIVPTCRACLKTSLSYIDLETPFEQKVFGIRLDNQTNAFTTYMDCFRACTQLLATDREEQMPQSLCEQCGFELGIAWNFLQKAIQTDKVLKTFIGSRKLKEHIKGGQVGDDNEYHTEIAIVSDENTFTADKVEENSESFSDNEGVTKENVIVDESENEDEMVFCLTCSSYFNSKFEHSHISTLGTCIKIIDETQLNTSFSTDLLRSDKKKDEDPYAANNNGSPNIEYCILEVRDVSVENNSKTNESSEECEDVKKVLKEDSIDSVISKEIDGSCDKIIDKNSSSVFYCSTCFQSFETRRGLLLHTRTHSTIDGKELVCKICNKKVNKEETMRKHIKNTHSTIIQCTECSYRCPELKMSDHIRRYHAKSKNFACNICDKMFVCQSLLNTHHKYHQRKEANIKSDACEICGKRFSTQHYLRLHVEVHRNERQLHQCDYCDKIYVSKIALENHIRLHKGETINCDQCGKQFVRQYELNVHMRFHTRDYPFKCDVCGKKFAIKGHLRTHMWRHQGLKLQCEECGKLFTSTKALQEHSFVHSEMPFPCSYCGRGYPSKQKFKVHLKMTHLIELTEEELLKVTKSQPPKPLQRKKLTLVQADSVMKEIEVKDSGEEAVNEGEEILVELY
ncbi:oocyte zinc finger protein XlCOF6-like [Anastrepha ludens]|uniref:oocyte zinc finger protein XlCOF6-like n=1 Tax=Anastrepha ludens TaxID=28586 RepID=UPI0023AF3845|nr:oocyte zinc finger protein XlCOF6-like [Anastrepha ludens]